ncbi:acyl-CoA dehydrogenase family protein [Rhizobium rhizogenes]|uniref:acyl-CoA dehydrogenase family protein n=1 Tax=Rhizobium rhizogenes TaxID=359 RepID=UPI00157383C3|nr:acyl-CoA dehydrogenase family protein [Rhizobium rhizogenes]NTH23373.1 acyl-CoA/acyl-ACP dehydrogenase [Rhizobium rhizogenes]NTH36395.1 acyl-CoA/acyl-ACP dehydrogenase [Rhizobium rhizogenes]
MNFDLTDEQLMMMATARQIGERFGTEYWRVKDAAKEYPFECWQAICDAGLTGAMLPEEYGGAGLGLVDMALIIEELCKAGAGATLAQMFMLNPVFGGVAINKYGSPSMKREWLPKLCSGEMTFCMALTEPDAGTNSLSLKTTARRNGPAWRINGQKIWITGVPQSQKMLVVARTTPEAESPRKTFGISLFMIDTKRAGLSHTPIEKLGTNTLPSSSVFFDDVEAHEDEVLGTIDGGWEQLLDVLNTERVVTTAGLVGAGYLGISLAVNYAKERKVFNGKPIGSYQGVQFPLAQHWAEIEAARLLNLKAASNFDNGLPFGSESNAAKLIASQAASAVIERAMQVMGGMGYAKEFHAERLWRDARLFRFAPVSEEMILNFIAMNNLGLPRSY